jgi:hypothetical protein
MSTGDEVMGSPGLPKTIDELKEQTAALKRCTSCRQKQATRTVSLTIAKLGAGRGSTEFAIQRVPVCEPCAAQVGGLVQRALKA